MLRIKNADSVVQAVDYYKKTISPESFSLELSGNNYQEMISTSARFIYKTQFFFLRGTEGNTEICVLDTVSIFTKGELLDRFFLG
jgi:hypothetical protein